MWGQVIFIYMALYRKSQPASKGFTKQQQQKLKQWKKAEATEEGSLSQNRQICKMSHVQNSQKQNHNINKFKMLAHKKWNIFLTLSFGDDLILQYLSTNVSLENLL